MREIGFTLIELVIVIVILAIVSTFTFRFVGIGADMYVTSAERLQLLEQSRFAIERITREIRNAVPNSVRVTPANPVSENFQCLEFVPIKVAGTYYNAPFQPSDEKNLDFVSMTEQWGQGAGEITTADRLFIYATLPAWIYADATTTERRFAVIDENTSRAGELTQLTLESGSVFSEQSPRQRLYVGRPPVSYCVEGDKLFRYDGYQWSDIQPEPADLPINRRVQMSADLVNLMASPATGEKVPFQIDRSVLRRNNIVHVFLEYRSRQQERLFYNQEIRIPNAP
jgi:MSHA biogenesis protein MshO